MSDVAPATTAETRKPGLKARVMTTPIFRLSLPWVSAMWVSIGLALVVTKGELSRLAGSVLTTDGRVWSLTDLMGISAWGSRDGWRAEFTNDRLWDALLVLYLVVDLALVVVYAMLLWRIFWRRTFTGFWKAAVGVLFIALVAVNILVDLLAFAGIAFEVSALGLAFGFQLKTLLAVASAVAAVVAVITSNGATSGTRLTSARKIVWQLRFAIVPLAVLTVVAVIPGPNILDQVADIERRWTDGPRNFFIEGGSAGLALVFLAAMLFLIGRARAQVAARFPDGDESGLPPARLIRWVLLAAVFVVGGLTLRWAGAPVAIVRLGAVVVLLLLVAGTSRYLRDHKKAWLPDDDPTEKDEPTKEDKPPKKDKRSKQRTWTAPELRQTIRLGDALAIAVLLVGGLGAIRALTAIAALAALTEAVEFNGWAFILLISGWVVTVGLWPLYGARQYPFLRPLKKILGHDWLRPSLGQTTPSMLKRFPRILLVVSLSLFLFLGLAPTVAGQLGVLFCFVMSLASITGIVVGIALITRKHRPAEVFQLLRLRSTPTLGLLLVALVFAGQVNTLSDVHTVRAELRNPLELAGVTPSPEAVGTDVRPDLPEAFATWMAQRDPDCALRRQLTIQGEPREVELVPMVMIAAEGGGIRAAYWAVQSVQQLAAQPCPGTSVFLSSGVSGGALGLAAVRFNQNPTEVVTQMSNSRALSYGIVGLMVRDFVYAATGLPLPAVRSWRRQRMAGPRGADGGRLERLRRVRGGLVRPRMGHRGAIPGHRTVDHELDVGGPGLSRLDQRHPAPTDRRRHLGWWRQDQL